LHIFQFIILTSHAEFISASNKNLFETLKQVQGDITNHVQEKFSCNNINNVIKYRTDKLKMRT